MPEQPFLPIEAARTALRLKFSESDLARMNKLAAKNRDGKLTAAEDEELDHYIRVGQALGILQSKARHLLKDLDESSE
jgi:hypothetical protein